MSLSIIKEGSQFTSFPIVLFAILYTNVVHEITEVGIVRYRVASNIF